MKVESLHLRNFRNVSDSTLEPGPHLNFLTGANGQGKTSYLEALGMLATLRSFRGAKAAELIQHGTQNADIACQITSDDEFSGPGESSSGAWKTELKIDFEMMDPQASRATKIAKINGKPFRSSTQYLSQRFGNFELGFHTVVFNPADHDLVRGEPSVRRAYLDRVLSANDVEYLKIFQKYQRTLEQRNAVLKNSERPSRDLLAGFTQPLGTYAAQLVQKRLVWLSEIAQKLDNTARKITPPAAPLRVYYASSWLNICDAISNTYPGIYPLNFAGHGTLPSLELLEQSFWNQASRHEAAEWRAGHTLVGPHRDDWVFFFGDQPLKARGSQGEVRSALLALKILEIELFRNATGHRPLFLLDDFSSELDQERRTFLLRFLSETDLQVFVTATEAGEFAYEGRRFRVSNGKVEPVR